MKCFRFVFVAIAAWVWMLSASVGLASAQCPCNAPRQAVGQPIQTVSGKTIVLAADGHYYYASDLAAKKAPCVCGDSCACAPGVCPAKCPTAPAVAPKAKRVLYYQQVCNNGRCQLVPVYEP